MTPPSRWTGGRRTRRHATSAPSGRLTDASRPAKQATHRPASAHDATPTPCDTGSIESGCALTVGSNQRTMRAVANARAPMAVLPTAGTPAPSISRGARSRTTLDPIGSDHGRGTRHPSRPLSAARSLLRAVYPRLSTDVSTQQADSHPDTGIEPGSASSIRIAACARRVPTSLILVITGSVTQQPVMRKLMVFRPGTCGVTTGGRGTS